MAPGEVVSAELGTYLCGLSREIERQVGVLISRRGDVEHVFVGDASRIMLPEVGRLRAGRGRFRGLRLVHTHLRNEPLTRDDLVDLALLRLDLVAAVGVTRDGRPADLHLAHLFPPVEGKPAWTVLPPTLFHRTEIVFLQTYREKTLHEVFGVVRIVAETPDKGVEGIPIISAQFFERRARAG